ncbi:glycosyltransferase family 4 protein [Terrabacter lapilli]|uniref:Glycosyltransferase family 4 protein n=1 Tax=Terrabacter lapilli TaxID=436231 RepID=A0ABN2RBI9_9MICO
MLTSNGRYIQEIENAGFKVHTLKVDRASLNPLSELRVILSVARVIRQVRPTIIHNVALKPVVYGSIASIFGGRPRVINLIAGLGSGFAKQGRSAHALRLAILGLLRVAVSASGSHVVVQNEDDLEELVKGKVVAPRNASLIRGSGVDTEAFHPTTRPDRVPVVVLPSRLLRSKGVEDFVDSARRLLAQGVVARFVLVGTPDPNNRNSVTADQIAGWDAEGSVEIWGWRNDMPTVFASADIVCLPTRYREGIPKSLIDAASCGLPLVATNTPGCRDIVRHGLNGYTVNVDDADSLDSSLKKLIADRSMRLRMGAESRALVESEFAEEIVLAQTLSLYESSPAGAESKVLS